MSKTATALGAVVCAVLMAGGLLEASLAGDAREKPMPHGAIRFRGLLGHFVPFGAVVLVLYTLRKVEIENVEVEGIMHPSTVST